MIHRCSEHSLVTKMIHDDSALHGSRILLDDVQITWRGDL